VILAWDAIFRFEDGTVYCSGAFTWFLVGLIVAILVSK
jgi:hypothetical protein